MRAPPLVLLLLAALVAPSGGGSPDTDALRWPRGDSGVVADPAPDSPVPEGPRSGGTSKPRLLPRGTRWGGPAPIHLPGTVVVAPGDTLRIEAGTRVVAEAGTEVLVSPGAVLLAEGTATLPIDLACAGPVTPGCWGGVTLQGDAPGAPGSSSGTLRHVRIRGGRLRLESVGSGTLIDRIQVDRAAADGVEVVGGTVRLRRLYLTRNPGYGLAWSGGWAGRAQQVAVVADPAAFQGGIRGSGTGGAAPGPDLLNVTVVATPSQIHPTGEAPAVTLDGGAAGSLRNLLLVQPGVALDIDGADTCANLASGVLVLDHVLVGGAALLGDPDQDPVPCGPWPSPTVEQAVLQDPARANVFLREPSDAANLLQMSMKVDDLVDLRPLSARSDTLAPFPPPDDGFFDPSALFFGAVDGRGLPAGTIPWTAGWTADFPFTLPALPVPAFDLDVRPIGVLSPTVFQAFRDAERRWESAVVEDVPDLDVDLAPELCLAGSPGLVESLDDVVVFAEVDSIDGPGGVVGQAGPCVIRAASDLPLVGLLRLDSADVASLEAAGVLGDLILHELAHVLGFGTLWTRVGLLEGGGTANPTFVGPMAVAEYQALGGGEGSVPVEGTGGVGTRDAHWRESVFGNEIMTGFISLSGNPLSALTIRSLGDLGYSVDPLAADPFGVPGPARVAPPLAPMQIEELLVRPRWTR